MVAGGGFLSYWYQQIIKLINFKILIFLILGVSGYDRKEIHPRQPLIHLQKVTSQHVFFPFVKEVCDVYCTLLLKADKKRTTKRFIKQKHALKNSKIFL